MNGRLRHCAVVGVCAAFLSAPGQTSWAAASEPRDPPTASAVPAPASAEPDFAKALEFWAFQPIRPPPVPKAQSSEFKVRNPVDAFVLAGLQEKGLTPAPPASKAELIRRLCFDLTGLPPSPDEVM